MKTDFAFLILAVTVFILKLLDLPGSNMIFVISFIHIAIFYAFLSFYLFRDKQFRIQNLPFSMLAGLIFCFSTWGILNQLMHWDQAFLYLITGCILTIFVLSMALFLKNKSGNELQIYYQNMIIRSTVFLFLQLTCLTL